MVGKRENFRLRRSKRYVKFDMFSVALPTIPLCLGGGSDDDRMTEGGWGVPDPGFPDDVICECSLSVMFLTSNNGSYTKTVLYTVLAAHRRGSFRSSFPRRLHVNQCFSGQSGLRAGERG